MTLLSKTECSALRGFAIIGIFMHNFLHWLNPMVKENEYQFYENNVNRLMSILSHPDQDLLWQLFSFFGHYGVPVFLFLSGYGLVMKYEGKGAKPAADRFHLSFISSHFMKLFPMMMLGFVCFAMIDWITPNRHHWAWVDIIAQITMTINLLPNPDDIIWPGPYWFFGLMMQLYIIYILLLHNKGSKWTVALIVACWAIQAACMYDPEGETLNRIRYNSIGGMLPFGMGILLARWDKAASSDSCRPRLLQSSWFYLVLAIVSAAIVLCFSLNFHTWLWAPAAVVIFNVALVKCLPDTCLKPLDWMGALSAAIFVCHPITRKIFIPISRGGAIADGLVIYIVATIVLAMLFRLTISQLRKR